MFKLIISLASLPSRLIALEQRLAHTEAKVHRQSVHHHTELAGIEADIDILREATNLPKRTAAKPTRRALNAMDAAAHSDAAATMDRIAAKFAEVDA